MILQIILRKRLRKKLCRQKEVKNMAPQIKKAIYSKGNLTASQVA